MVHLLTLFSFLYAFAPALKAALPAPFKCEIKEGINIDKLTSEHKQWLLLLDISPLWIDEVSLDNKMITSFEDTYWKSFQEIKKKVHNCDEMLAFWQRFGESIELSFQQSEPLSADISHLEGTVFAYEMRKQKKIFFPTAEFIPKAIIQKVGLDGARPWWKVKTSGHKNERIFQIPHYYPSTGPLAALISYEILRKWQNNFPRDFWHKDVLLTQERAQILSLTFPWAKSLFVFIEGLPPRERLSKSLNLACAILTLALFFRLIWALFRDFLTKK